MNRELFEKKENIITNYIAMYDKVKDNVTASDFEAWLDLIPEPLKSSFEKQGIDAAKKSENFRDWYMDKNGDSLERYLKEIE